MNILTKLAGIAFCSAFVFLASHSEAKADRYSWRPDSFRDYNSGIYENGYRNNYRVPGYGTYYRGYGATYSPRRHRMYYGAPNYGPYRYTPGYYRYNYNYRTYPYPSYQYNYHYGY